MQIYELATLRLFLLAETFIVQTTLIMTDFYIKILAWKNITFVRIKQNLCYESFYLGLEHIPKPIA